MSWWRSPDPKGRLSIRCRPTFPKGAEPWAWVRFFVDQLFCDLDGASSEILGTCPVCSDYFIGAAAGRRNYCSDRCRRPQCRHLFIRARAKRRLYCSKRCRNFAVLEGLTQKAGPHREKDWGKN